MKLKCSTKNWIHKLKHAWSIFPCFVKCVLQLVCSKKVYPSLSHNLFPRKKGNVFVLNWVLSLYSLSLFCKKEEKVLGRFCMIESNWKRNWGAIFWFLVGNTINAILEFFLGTCVVQKLERERYLRLAGGFLVILAVVYLKVYGLSPFLGVCHVYFIPGNFFWLMACKNLVIRYIRK